MTSAPAAWRYLARRYWPGEPQKAAQQHVLSVGVSRARLTYRHYRHRRGPFDGYRLCKIASVLGSTTAGGQDLSPAVGRLVAGVATGRGWRGLLWPSGAGR